MEFFEYAELFSVYNELLPPAQADVLRAYYFDNIGLSEQAETRNVTKQAINDCHKKGQRALKEFEEKLGLAAMYKTAKQVLSDADYKKIFEEGEK